MREGGQRSVERLVEHDLLGRIGDVVGAADDVRHAHVDVVGDDAEMISGHAVGAQ